LPTEKGCGPAGAAGACAISTPAAIPISSAAAPVINKADLFISLS
jgi:hypothetical protein